MQSCFHKSVLLVIISALFSTVSFSRNKFREDGHRNIYTNLPSKKISAVVNTKKKIKVKISKTYSWYDNISVHETVGGYSGYLLDGTYTEFYFPSNNLCISGVFKNGLKKGMWLFWSEKGLIKERATWSNGEMHGKRYIYADDGTLMSVEIYKHGKLNSRRDVANKTELTYKEKRSVEMGKKNRLNKKEKSNKRASLVETSNKKEPVQTKAGQQKKQEIQGHKKKNKWQAIRSVFSKK